MAENFNESAVEAIQGQGVTPPALGTIANMAPLTAAGIDLARRTMVMIAGAIIALLILLLFAESGQRSDITRMNERLFAVLATDGPSSAEPRLAMATALLRRSAADPAWPIPDTKELGELIDDALKTKSLSIEDRTSMDGKCVPLPQVGALDRAAILERCAAILVKIFGRGDGAGQRIEAVQLLQKSLAEERASHRAFWLQVAQLVLINLLLPILTALLGYIFGTQQGQKTS